MATVKDMLMCPKCRKKMMGKAIPQKFGMEYYAHCCHQYFGVNELVNQWSYDAADLTPIYPVTHGNYKNWIPKGNYPMTILVQKNKPSTNVPLSLHYTFDTNVPHYSEFDSGEPYWMSGKERNSAYQMVTRMFLGIPELDDYADMLATQEDTLGIGVQ